MVVPDLLRMFSIPPRPSRGEPNARHRPAVTRPEDLFDLVVVHPDAKIDRAELSRVLEEASAAVPTGYRPHQGPELLPRRPLTARCRLCGQTLKLTREHLPPQATGNKSTHYAQSFTGWIDADDRARPRRGRHEQGGVWGYTLCKACNERTGQHYGTEYLGWVIRAEKVIAELPPPRQIDREPEAKGLEAQFGGASDGGVTPGRFVRQVLSMMCSLSGEWDLAGRQPAIRRIILEQSVEPLPGELRVSMSIFLGPHSRIAGPQLRVDIASGEWAWVMELAHRPFAFLMVLASNIETHAGLDIGELTEVDVDRHVAYTAMFDVGFGWSAYPGDYRSSAALGWPDPLASS